ncbi:MAG: hypothetical protein JWP03_3609 [Phycisphaerales bacterium]|jgi:hypothetical protein|nr:hypothetical protein [Phycisphaerales bacterium]
MTLTIDLPADLEARLRDEAARQGVDAAGYIVKALTDRLSPKGGVPHLPADEARLLEQINLGVSADTWQRYRALGEKRDARALADSEHDELIAISDRIEEANARRMRYVVELARLRGVSPQELMRQLGVAGPAHV